MSITPYICAIISFLIVLFFTPWWIKYLKKIGLTVKDQNKENKPLVTISGGLAVFSGFFIGMMCFIFSRFFLSEESVVINLTPQALLYLFAGIITITIITLIGFLDDLVVTKSRENSKGLKQWQKPLLTLIAAVPLMVVGAGTKTMGIPLFGEINFGIIYPLIFIPLGVVFAANMVNLLAGFNGLEAGMGLIYMGMLGLYAFVNESYIGALLALMTFSSLLAFYIYNKSPAKIIPGDSGTYLLGAMIATIAILGNLEKAAIIISIPFIIEFFLKARSKFKAQTYGYYHNGKIRSLHNKKIYSIPHILTRTGKFTEKEIVYFCLALEFIVASMIWFI